MKTLEKLCEVHMNRDPDAGEYESYIPTALSRAYVTRKKAQYSRLVRQLSLLVDVQREIVSFGTYRGGKLIPSKLHASANASVRLADLYRRERVCVQAMRYITLTFQVECAELDTP